MSAATATDLSEGLVGDPQFDRTPPSDVAAEQAVLGAMMLSEHAADDVIDILQPRDFYRPVHGTLFELMVSRLGRNLPIDPIAMADTLDRSGDLQRLGGAPYLHTLVATPPTAANGAYYARIVAERAVLRRMVEAGTRIVQLGYGQGDDSSRDVEDIVDLAQRTIHEATAANQQSTVAAVGDLVDDELAHLRALAEGRVPKGISSGLGALDKLLGGFRPGQLVIPAGRPGMGKSIAALGFAKAAAQRGYPSIIFSLEMSKRELMWRLLSDVGEINSHLFLSGNLSERDLARAEAASREIASWPLHVVDDCHTVAQIRSISRRFHQRYGSIGVLAVDYLQRLRETKAYDRRDLAVGANARDLKFLAQELQCTVIAPAQINRGNEGRTDKRPQLSDLRDSGEIEQEADIVILLHREDYYDQESPRAGEADMIIAKHRGGPTDTVAVAAPLHYSRFVDFGFDDDESLY
ncbi:replicative DNA helicase [Micromonospora maritima]|uniref:replicative DNA helicase n=1 Tax=Micromonospora maritima TaxID=986711 RepID=UPI001FE80B69|nr:replicative DNA helicase [Micromonospora maritima]